MSWEPAQFEVAEHSGPRPVDGYVYKGLGLHISSQYKARYKRKDGTRKVTQHWTITHLNTGHAICLMQGTVSDVFPPAYDLAELADWDFEGLAGWKNRCPELPELFMEWSKKNPCRRTVGHADDGIARAISAKRW